MIPRDSKFCEFSFQTLAEGTVVPGIVGSNTKQFVGDPIFAQDFQVNAGHIFAGAVLTETFKAHDLLMKLEIVIDVIDEDDSDANLDVSDIHADIEAAVRDKLIAWWGLEVKSVTLTA